MSKKSQRKGEDSDRVDPSLSAKLSSKQNWSSSLIKRDPREDDDSGYVPEIKLTSGVRRAKDRVISSKFNSKEPNESGVNNELVKKNQSGNFTSPIPVTPQLIKKIQKTHFQENTFELNKVENCLENGFVFYKILLAVYFIFSLGSLIGLSFVALQEPFEIALVPVCLWMGFNCILVTIMYDAHKTKNPENQRLSLQCLICGLAGNVIVLVYLCTRAIEEFPNAGDNLGSYLGLTIYILCYIFFEIIFLFLMIPEATRTQKLLDHRENLLCVLNPVDMNVYNV